MSAYVRSACAECGTFVTVEAEEWHPGLLCDPCYDLRRQLPQERIVAIREYGNRVEMEGGEREEGSRTDVRGGADRGNDRVGAAPEDEQVSGARSVSPVDEWASGAGSGDPALDVMAASVAQHRKGVPSDE